MNELLALCSKLSEKAEKSQFQYLSIPTTENGSTTSSNIETYIAQGRQDIANIHKENQRFNKSFEEALRRLR